MTEVLIECQVCKEILEPEEVYYSHPQLGFVCENCPEFEDGGIKPIKEIQ